MDRQSLRSYEELLRKDKNSRVEDSKSLKYLIINFLRIREAKDKPYIRKKVTIGFNISYKQINTLKISIKYKNK